MQNYYLHFKSTENATTTSSETIGPDDRISTTLLTTQAADASSTISSIEKTTKVLPTLTDFAEVVAVTTTPSTQSESILDTTKTTIYSTTRPILSTDTTESVGLVSTPGFVSTESSFLPIPDVNCYVQGNALAYRGNVSKTESNISCQKWTSQHPHMHS